MSAKTGIEWTRGDDGTPGATWNPLAGCQRVSPGCDYCYAAREVSGRLSGHPVYAGLAAGGVFTGEVRLLADRLEQPLRWRKPKRIFVNSMSDLFHPSVPDAFIATVFAVMSLASHHTFQVLTKRPQRAQRLLSQVTREPEVGFLDLVAGAEDELVEEFEIRHGRVLEPAGEGWPLRNVWLGTSIELPGYGFRAEALLATPAAVRFISAEPLLGQVDLGRYLVTDEHRAHSSDGRWHDDCPFCVRRRRLGGADRGLDWVIVGGESGPAARPMHPGWARQLRDQCQAARVPFFFKQAGEWSADEQLVKERHGGGFVDDVVFDEDGTRVPDEEVAWVGDRRAVTTLYRVGRRAAGHELDGRSWSEFPLAAQGGSQ